MKCVHRPRKTDTKAGYDHCMFCEETGDCDGKAGYCAGHRYTWDHWEEQIADARNSAF